MSRILWNQQSRVLSFVSSRIGVRRFFSDAWAIGLERHGEIVAGVVFEGKRDSSILAHVACNGSDHWVTASYAAACFYYPFRHETCSRIIGYVRADNLDCRRFCEHLGFKCGGVSTVCSDGVGVINYHMLKSECRYVEGRYASALQDYIQREAVACAPPWWN